MVGEFNKRISNTHYAYYNDEESSLIDRSINASPNGNQIYHLYSTGKITQQKGACAYLQRSEFTIKGDIVGAMKNGF